TNCAFLFTLGEKKLSTQGYFADSAFLTMFSFPLVEGNISTALNSVNKIVLTQKFAKALFGNEDPLGKTLKIDTLNYVTVGGVLKDLPNNTQMKFNYLLSWDYAKKVGQYDEYWGNNSVQNYVLLKPNTNLASFNAKIQNITIKHSKGETTKEFAFPFSKYYLYNESENGQFVTGRIVQVRMFAIIAAFILLIACINFMNLSTARSEKRAKEVGMRKVVGAYRSSLIVQFIFESVFITLIAFVLALIIVLISLPFFNHLVDMQLALSFSNPYTWFFVIAFILLTGLLAGSYPAFYLSSFEPVKVLKGTFRRTKSKVNLRSVLVVIQFTFAIILIISTVIVTKQIRYTQQRDSGYDRNSLVYSFLSGKVNKNFLLIKNEMLQSGAVTSVTKSMSPITNQWSDGWGITWAGSTDADKKTDFGRFSTDADFVKTMQMKLVAGRDIDVYHYPTDSFAVLLNETAVKVMHLKNPIGTIVTDDTTFHVVGVVKDFIINGVSDKIEPMIVFGPALWFNVMHYRLNTARPTKDNLDVIKSILKKYNPEYPFDYTFISEDYAQKFKETQKIGTLSTLFAGLTIFISCLGLLGLVTFMAEARTKEIGVRKVLGASVATIVQLLTKDFLKLVLVSFIIAAPVAWYVMHRWLSNYDYRVSIAWWWFALAGVIAMLIAFATVSRQAIKAARANPMKSLKTE
ncbi:MAG TPA: FtsX-like permease family protein, partial [Arachidicoccus sp.]